MQLRKYFLFFVLLGLINPAFAVNVDTFGEFYEAYKTGSGGNISIYSDLVASRLLGFGALSNITIDADNHSFNADGFNGFSVSSGTSLNILNAGSFSVSDNLVNITKSFNNFYQSLRGAVFINSGGTINISNSAFTNNKAGRAGGVIQQARGSLLNVSNSAFVNNKVTSGDGGALNNEYGASASIVSSFFQNNNVGRYGGAIFNDGNLSVDKSLFVDNQADSGSAIYNANQAIISNSIFKNNISTDDVGAVYNAQTIEISSSAFDNNSGISGGAFGNFGIPDESYSVIRNSIFTGNKATYGGAIFSWDDLYIIDTSFFNNIAEDTGGAIFNGSNLYLIAQNADMIFSGNQAFGVSNAIQTDTAININVAENKNIIFNDRIAGSGSIVINRGYDFEGAQVGTTGNVYLNEDMTGFTGNVEIDGGKLIVLNNGKFFSATDLTVNDGVLNLGASTANVENVTLNEGAELDVLIDAVDSYGKIVADSITVAPNTSLNMVLSASMVGKDESFQVRILESSSEITQGFESVQHNNLYDFTKLENGLYEVSKVNTPSGIVGEVGGNENNENTADAWDDEENSVQRTELEQAIYDRLFYLAQTDAKEFITALTILAPTSAPIVRALSYSYMDNFVNFISDDFDDRDSYEIGDLVLWGASTISDGTINKKGIHGEFDLDAYSFALGAEYSMKDLTVGLGYMYQFDKLESWARSISTPTNGFGIYTKYNNGGFLWNTTASWFASRMKETKNLAGISLDVNPSLYTFSAQSEIGYDFNTVWFNFTPSVGARYIMAHKSAATDDVGQEQLSDNTYAMLGYGNLAVEKQFVVGETLKLIPVIEIGASYDLRDTKDISAVRLNSYIYNIVSDDFERWQTNFSAKLKAKIGNSAELHIGADFSYRKNYQDFTGSIKGSYKF